MIGERGEKKPRIADSAFVSEAAYVVGDVEIGENSSIWPGAVLRADRFRIRIGSNCNIQDNCVVHAGFSDVNRRGDARGRAGSGNRNKVLIR